MANQYNLDGTELQNAIIETFKHRGTDFDDIAAFENNFTEDALRKQRWKAFIRKKKALVKVDFEDTMILIKALLMPIIDAIRTNVVFEKNWSKGTKSWM